MNHQLILFLKKALALFAAIACADYSLGHLLEYYYLKMQATAAEYHLTYSVNKAREEIMVFGSSRAQHHYDPVPITNAFNKTFYNTGQDGQGIIFSYALFKNLLQRNHLPQIIILDLGPTEFHKHQDAYDRLAELLPYYENSAAVREVLQLRSPYEKIKSLSMLYRFNSLFFTILKHNFLPSGAPAQYGYEPIEAKKDSLQLNEFKASETIDTLEVAIFRDFLKKATMANCKVFVAVSPSYRNYKGFTKTIKIARTICRSLDIEFLDFNQDPLFLNNPGYFADPAHLNKEGAKVYSQLIANKIKQDLQM